MEGNIVVLAWKVFNSVNFSIVSEERNEQVNLIRNSEENYHPLETKHGYQINT